MKKDLIILVADQDTRNLLDGLLPRIHKIEKLRDFAFDIRVHVNRDNGVLNDGVNFLRSFLNTHHYAIAMFDFEGCGRENNQTRYAIESAFESSLASNGWSSNNCATIVIEPEIETWIWVKSPHLPAAIDWAFNEDIYLWLEKKGFLEHGQLKPSRPKEAFEAALRACSVARSPAIYKAIASKASYKHCQDASLWKLIETLRIWFPE